MPRNAGMVCDHSSSPDSGSTPTSRSRVCTSNCRLPATSASSGDENALPHIPPSSLSDRQRILPFRLSSLQKRCAGLNVHVRAVDQWRAHEAERGNGRAEFLHEINPPARLARAGVETDQDVSHPSHEQAFAVVCGRGANPVAVRLREKRDGQRAVPRRLPTLLAGFPIQRPDDLAGLVLGLGGEHQCLGHDRAGITGAERTRHSNSSESPDRRSGHAGPKI